MNAPNDDKAPYGYCPVCKARGVMRERRPDGNDQCENGHTYPAKDAIHMVPCPDCCRDWGHSYCGTCKGAGWIKTLK